MGKRYLKKKNKFGWLIFTLIIIVLIICINFAIHAFIDKKLSNVTFKDLNKQELSISDKVYEKVSDTLSEKEFNNVRNILLLGIDNQNPEYYGDDGRSDTIMIVSINPKFNSLKMISIPRDTYVEIEGHGKDKINYAYAFGEEELTIKTLNSNFNLNISEYVTIDFEGLIHVINEIDGIQLNISKAEKEFINTRSELAYDITGNKRKLLSSYGKVTLDGEQALTHSRNRKVGDDFVRAERQRDVIEAILNKMSKMDMGQISSMLDLFLKEVTTNINVADYIGTITEILLNKNAYLGNVVSEQVPSKDYAEGEYIKGIYYFVPSDTERMKEDMINYLYKR